MASTDHAVASRTSSETSLGMKTGTSTPPGELQFFRAVEAERATASAMAGAEARTRTARDRGSLASATAEDIAATAEDIAATTAGDVMNVLDDVRVRTVKPLVPPQILIEDVPLTAEACSTIARGRAECENIIHGRDDRLLVVVGPCSIHDTRAALEYAQRLRAYADTVKDDLLIVMRVYFEKPRTTVGWKGLINDPWLDGSFRINKGLRIARELLMAINELGMPIGCEFLDTISPQYYGDLVTWGAIGARTTESQIHRELASGLSVPVGFKNATEGNVQVAIDAIKAAREAHHFLSVTKQGLSAIVCTAGNDACHVILRGGATGPNYSAQHVHATASKLQKAGVRDSIMIDCSHGNSEKQFRRQITVAADIAKQLSGDLGVDGVSTANAIFGVMLESHLVEGRQDISQATGPQGAGLVYGQSITDACLGWEDTVTALQSLRLGVRKRREMAATLSASGQ